MYAIRSYYAVLKAISLTETGRKTGGQFRPWPWTVNMEGTGHWFDTLDEARAYVSREFKRGARSFDVGCFQIVITSYSIHYTKLYDTLRPDQADYIGVTVEGPFKSDHYRY